MKEACITSILLSFLLIACSKGGNDAGGGNNLDCTATAKSFSADVLPIVTTVCSEAGCHNSGSTNGPGPLTNYTEVFDARVLVRSSIESGFMPRNSTLTASQKKSFLCWIDSGAPNN